MDSLDDPIPQDSNAFPDPEEIDGAIALTTEAGMVVYEPDRPEAWLYSDHVRELD